MNCNCNRVAVGRALLTAAIKKGSFTDSAQKGFDSLWPVGIFPRFLIQGIAEEIAAAVVAKYGLERRED